MIPDVDQTSQREIPLSFAALESPDFRAVPGLTGDVRVRSQDS